MIIHFDKMQVNRDKGDYIPSDEELAELYDEYEHYEDTGGVQRMTNKEAMEILTSIKNTPAIKWENGADIAFDLAIKALDERPQGKWVNQSQGAKYPCECSECHTEPFCNGEGYVLSNFCPNCGADMRGKDELNNELNELKEIQK